MKITKAFDIILNVALPLLVGYFIYFINSTEKFYPALKNHLPDGLWAYSFISLILIIWNRRLNLYWIVFGYLFAAGFELFQYLRLVPGTADMIDVIVYFIFMGMGIGINNFFKNPHGKPLQ